MANYDYYRIFYYVAQYQSFTKAAEMLRNNQPNITRYINNLESELGCKLFIRSNRGVKLTPEGENCPGTFKTRRKRITERKGIKQRSDHFRCQ